MTIPYESVTSGANPTVDSLLIPFGDLFGLTDASELGNSTPEDDGKIASSFKITLADKVATLTSPLGLAVAKPNPTGAGTDIIRQNVATTWSYVIDFSQGEVTVYPAVLGSSREVAFTDVFPNAEVVATTGSATADSLAIALSDIQSYDPDATVANLQGSLADDQRKLLESMTRMIFILSDVRTASVASAVQAKNRGNVNGSNVPNNFFADTTFVETDRPKLGWFSLNYSMTFEYKLNQNTQMFDVNVVTA